MSPLSVSVYSLQEFLNEPIIEQYIQREWKNVSFPLTTTRLFSPIVKGAGYIDLDLEQMMEEWGIQSVIAADVIESGRNDEG